jgi:hypothetical protein
LAAVQSSSLLVLVTICAPLIVALLGQPRQEFHYEKIAPDLQIPRSGASPGTCRAR